MTQNSLISLFLLVSAMSAGAQTVSNGVQFVGNDDRKVLRPDSVEERADSSSHEFEEWLRHEPLRLTPPDSITLICPLPPTTAVIAPTLLAPKHPPILLDVKKHIMTPAFRTEMQLAYASHLRAEQLKAQQGQLPMVGVNPLSLVGLAMHILLPHRKPKQEREREKLQRVIENY